MFALMTIITALPMGGSKIGEGGGGGVNRVASHPPYFSVYNILLYFISAGTDTVYLTRIFLLMQSLKYLDFCQSIYFNSFNSPHLKYS